MMKNWSTMLLAVALAIFTWFLVTGREVVETWLEMPVVMTNPPEGMVIEEGLLDKIQVRVRGPKGLVDSLSSQHLTYPLDVAHLKVGNQVVDINTDKLPLTASYEVIEVRPKRLTLVVDRRVSKKIALKPAWTGKLHPDYKLLDVTATPDFIQIRGPETKLRKITDANVLLREDFPEDVPEKWSETVGIQIDEEIEASPGQVRVEAFFGPKTRDIWVKLPLKVDIPDGYSAKVSQNFVRLHIEGPIFLFRNDEFRKEMEAALAFGGVIAPGTFDLAYNVVLPEGCRLIETKPQTVKTVIKQH